MRFKSHLFEKYCLGEGRNVKQNVKNTHRKCTENAHKKHA